MVKRTKEIIGKTNKTIDGLCDGIEMAVVGRHGDEAMGLGGIKESFILLPQRDRQKKYLTPAVIKLVIDISIAMLHDKVENNDHQYANTREASQYSPSEINPTFLNI